MGGRSKRDLEKRLKKATTMRSRGVQCNVEVKQVETQVNCAHLELCLIRHCRQLKMAPKRWHVVVLTLRPRVCDASAARVSCTFLWFSHFYNDLSPQISAADECTSTSERYRGQHFMDKLSATSWLMIPAP